MELILRFFAFDYHAKAYRSPMKDFLNRYMASNRDLAKQSEKELTTVFEGTTAVIAEAIGNRAFRPLTLHSVVEWCGVGEPRTSPALSEA